MVAFLAFAIMITFLLSIVFNALYVKELGNAIAVKENRVFELATEAGYFFVESSLAIKTVAYSINDLQESGADDDEIKEFLEDQTRVYSKTVNNDFTALYGLFHGRFHDGLGWTPTEGYDPTQRPWYQKAVEAKGEVALVSPYLDSKTQSVMMSLCKLLPDRESVVSIDVALNDLQKIVEESLADDDWLYSLILDGNGFVVAHSNSEELGKEYLEEDESFGKLLATRLLTDESTHFEMEYLGKQYYVFVNHVMSDWHAVCIIEKAKLMEPLNQIWLLFFAMLFTFLGCILFMFVRFNAHQGIEHALEGQIKLLTEMYDLVWYLDLQRDVFYEADVRTGALKLMGAGKERAEYHLREFMDGITDDRFKNSAFVFIDFSTLGMRLRGKSFLKLEFLDVKNRRCEARIIPAKWNENEEPSAVIWLLETEEKND